MADEKVTMRSLINDAVEEFREWAKDNPDETEPHDTIHEIADGAVPCYNSDLLDLAADDNEIALSEPDCGPAFDGTPTPINIIAANVFEAIEAALFDEWRTIEQEREDAKADAEVQS